MFKTSLPTSLQDSGESPPSALEKHLADIPGKRSRESVCNKGEIHESAGSPLRKKIKPNSSGLSVSDYCGVRFIFFFLFVPILQFFVNEWIQL